MGLLDQQIPFPLKLTVFELRAIAEAVESLTAVRAEVPYLDVAGHRVGDWYTVTSITRVTS